MAVLVCFCTVFRRIATHRRWSQYSIFTLLLGSASWDCDAQNASPSTAPTPPFTILDQTVALAGTTPIIYNLVLPPVVVAATPTPQPAATPSAAPDPGQDCFLNFSATVYDHSVTLLRLANPGGGVVAVSNVDFNYLTNIAQLSTATTVYDLVFALGNDSLADGNAGSTTSREIAQAMPLLPNGSAGYVIVSGSANPAAVAALNDIHAYCNANASTLTAAYNQRLEQEAQTAQQTPTPAPTPVVNFWPIKSALYGVGQ